MRYMQVISVMGTTCTGKSTLLDSFRNHSGVRLIEVGKWFKAKYPPEYFKGQMAPAHTQDEAFQMLSDAIEEATRDLPCGLVLVDGQPRSADQIERIDALAKRYDLRWQYLLLHASRACREERALKRHLELGEERRAEYLALLNARQTNDMIGYFEVIAKLLEERNIVSVDTEHHSLQQLQNVVHGMAFE